MASGKPKASRPHKDEIVDRARALIAKKRMPYVYKALMEEFNVSRSSAFTYVREARAYNRGLVDKDKDEIRADLANVLDEVVRSDARTQDRLQAVKLAMRLFGLETVNIRSEPPLFDPDQEQFELKDHVPSIDDGEADAEGLAVPATLAALGGRGPSAPHESNGQPHGD